MLLRPGVQGSGSRPVHRLGHHPVLGHRRPLHRAAVPVREGVRLAVDVGSVRVGVARSDPGGILASPLTALPAGSGVQDELAKLAVASGVIEVIVGLPTSLSGRDGAAAAGARGFAAGLAERLAPIPVRLVDERFTTATAHDALRRGGKDGRARRQVVDSAAAAVLLQAALDTERETGRPAGQLVASTRGDGA